METFKSHSASCFPHVIGTFPDQSKWIHHSLDFNSSLAWTDPCLLNHSAAGAFWTASIYCFHKHAAVNTLLIHLCPQRTDFST